MARFNQSVVINQPVERVFAFVSDFENDPPWSGVTGVRRTSAGPLGVGTTFQLTRRLLGRCLDVILEVTRYLPDDMPAGAIQADLAAFVASFGVMAVRTDETYDSLVRAAQVLT